MKDRLIRAKGRVLPAIALAAVLALTVAACDWQTFRYSPEHTGYNPTETAITPDNVGSLTLKWSGTLGVPTMSSPTVVDNVLYVGGQGLHAFSARGITGCTGAPKTCDPLWVAPNGWFDSSPAVSNGKVYAASYTSKLMSFDAAGKNGCSGNPTTCSPLWRAFEAFNSNGGSLSSAAVANGLVFVGDEDSSLNAYDAAGLQNCFDSPTVCNPRWHATFADIVNSSPAVSGGVVYVLTAGELYAFDAAGNANCVNGTACPLWTAQAFGDSSPAISNGIVHVASNNQLLAFDAAGTTNCSGTPKTCQPLWTATLGGSITSSPAVANGVVYIGSLDHKLYAFDAAGVTNCTNVSCSPLWTATAGDTISSSPAVANGVVYIGSEDNNMYAFDAAGSQGCANSVCTPLFTATTQGDVSSSPTIANGMLYFTSSDKHVYAYGLP
jgi:outer membrane protein assembly factor BamB